MPEIEILAYSALNLDEFIAFCVEGKPKASGGFEIDEEGREIRGVNSWLHGREVPAALFFNTPKDHPLQFFMALVEKDPNEVGDRPWFREIGTVPPAIKLEPEIAGIDKMLRMDGRVGTLTALPANGSISDLLAAIQPNETLNAEFAKGAKKVRDVLRQLETDPVMKKRFLAALRSDRGSRPTEVFAEIESKFKISF